MIKQMKLVFPPVILVGVCTATYIFCCALEIILRRLDIAGDELSAVRVLVLCLFAFFYGACRVCYFHPLCSSKYFKYLTIIPWDWSKPLPAGPVDLIWADVLNLVILTVIAFLNHTATTFLPVIFFLVSHILLLLVVFILSEQFKMAFLLLFLMPFVFFPAKNQYVALFVLISIYGVSYFGLRAWLESFPWKSRWWETEEKRNLRERHNAIGCVTWPYKWLNLYEVIPSFTLRTSLAVSILVTWWFYALFWEVLEEVIFFVILISFYISFMRFILYYGSLRPPISLAGRIANFRLIIPRYDKCLLAPIFVSLVGLGGCLLPALLEFYLSLSIMLTLMLVVFLTLWLGPSVKNWLLTYPGGPHRPIMKTGRSTGWVWRTETGCLDEWMRMLLGIKKR